MIVASGSTPLITLMKAAQLDVLHEPFDEVVISDAAFRELTTNPHLSEEADQVRPELRLSGTALRVLMALFTTIDLAYECRLAFFADTTPRGRENCLARWTPSSHRGALFGTQASAC